jgi:excisionase family DNA binding protein
MIDVDGKLSVHEAATRLGRSTEQVRRYLREGKLKGQRIGNQWWIDSSDLALMAGKGGPLIAPGLLGEIRELRERVSQRAGRHFDVVELLRQSRDEE